MSEPIAMIHGGDPKATLLNMFNQADDLTDVIIIAKKKDGNYCTTNTQMSYEITCGLLMYFHKIVQGLINVGGA